MALSFYNASDELTATTDALGNTTTYAYTVSGSGVPAGLQYCSVDPVDYQASVSCPAYGATHVTGTATKTFDSAGDLLSSTDADGNTTSYTYGVSGHPGLVATETDPDGTVTTDSYDGAGQQTSEVVTFASYSATSVTAYDADRAHVLHHRTSGLLARPHHLPGGDHLGLGLLGREPAPVHHRRGVDDRVFHGSVSGRPHHGRDPVGDLHGRHRHHLHRLQRR